MAQQIVDIITDMSSMSDEEILAKIQQLRRTRNIKPKISSKAKDRPAKGKKKEDTLVSLMAGLSDEERKNLLEKLSEK